MAVTPSAWSPSSWRERTALQQPEWPDAARAAAAVERLQASPPLVFAGEARALRDSLAQGARGTGLPAPGRRLRRVVQRALDDAHPREAEDHAADVRGAHLRRDAARGEGGADRGPVHEASLRADRRRHRLAEFPRPHGPRRRADGSRPRARPSTHGRGLQPVGADAEPAACVHEGRLRRPDPGASLEQGLRRELARGSPLRPAGR